MPPELQCCASYITAKYTQEAAKNVSSLLQRPRITFPALLSPSFPAPPVPAAHGQGASFQSAALLLLQGQLYLQRAWGLLGLEKELVEQEVGMDRLLKQTGKKISLYRHSSRDVTLLKETENTFKCTAKYFQAYVFF